MSEQSIGAMTAVQMRLLEYGRIGEFRVVDHGRAVAIAHAAATATGRRFQVRRDRSLLSWFFVRWVVREVSA